MRAADALVKIMEKKGVEYVFGIPGGANMPFYDALRDSDIKSILMRHEQQAAHAAEGYARVKRRPGVCSGTSGPGATNLITGLVDAYMDSSPVVAITGQVVRAFMGTDAFQEADIVGLVLPHIKYAVTVKDPQRVLQEFVNAYNIAAHHRPGPTLLDLPRDVFMEEVEENYDIQPEPLFNRPLPEPDIESIKQAAKLIAEAEKPVLLVGGGAVYSMAGKEILELAEHIAAPIVTTTMGKGAVPEDHPLVLGVVGMHGRVEADLAIVESDLVICIGSRLSDRAIGPAKEFEKNRKTIHIDIDVSEFGKNVRPTVSLPGDARKVLAELVEYTKAIVARRPECQLAKKLREIGEAYEEYMMAMDDGRVLHSWKVVSLLTDAVPPDTIVSTGVGQHQMWAQLFWKNRTPGTWLTSGGLGTMGFGLPAAFGAKAAAPDRIVMNLDGDGSFLMTCQTLACVADYELPVITVIFDNRSLGMVKQWQDMFYNKRYKDVEYNDRTDLVKLSEAFGVEAVRVESYDELLKAVMRAVRTNSALTVDVPVDTGELVFPMVPPGRWLEDVKLPPGFDLSQRIVAAGRMST
ncbi:MAG: biosynthetic-type acetolactate synthase large subunit [Candidatus Caldarchaeum sp.]|uniref:Acetolactate synthase n=1 Tax=Caldiarchaeum subterraneum TaxID=311458 RepID=A0A7C4DZT6_CALS0